MILTFMALCTLIVLAVGFFVVTLIGGGAFLVIFGDIIIFGLVIYWIIKKITRSKKK